MLLNIYKYLSSDMTLERLFKNNILSIDQYFFTVYFSFEKNNEKIMKRVKFEFIVVFIPACVSK
jgi:hypothetical protein